MHIQIKKKGNGTAILISFDTNVNKFESPAERTKFFTKLHGRKQVVTKESGKYEYYREGVLDEIPHLPVADSVFVIMQEHMKQMMKFFDEWEDKVELQTFPVMLEQKKLHELRKLEQERAQLIENHGGPIVLSRQKLEELKKKMKRDE